MRRTLIRDTIRLNSNTYQIARGKNGERLFAASSRPSQPGDPGGIEEATWRVDGPDGNSVEDEQGYLGREYGENTDGRWDNLDQLGPLINTVTLSTYDQTHSASILGTSTAKLQPSLMDELKRARPAGYWPLGDVSGNALDESTNANHAAVTIGGGVRNSLGLNVGGDGCINFDGAATAVTITDATPIQNIFDAGGSFCCLFNTGTFVGGRMLIRKGNIIWGLYTTAESAGTAKLRFEYDFDGATNGFWDSTDRVLITGHTMMVVLTYNADATTNDPTIYVYDFSTSILTTLTVGSGLIEVVTPAGTRVTDVGSTIVIGDRVGAAMWSGPLDEVAVFSTSLSAAQVALLTNASHGKVAGSLYLGPGDSPAPVDSIEQYGPYLYFNRGIHPAKVKISDMTLKRTGVTFKAPATTALTTRAGATNELSVGLGETSPYNVLTIAGDHPNTDTWAENDRGESARVIAAAPTEVVVLTGETVKGNVISGSVTMRNPNLSTRATVKNRDGKFTGFAMDGANWTLGRSDGPYVLDPDTDDFYPLIPEIDANDANCRGMTTWSFMGVVFGFLDGARYQKNGGGDSFGIEKWTGNTSAVQGYATAHAGSTRWLYQVVYNPISTDSYLVAWRPRQVGDPHPFSWSPFVLAKFTALQSKALRWLGLANGARSLPTLVGGYGSNAFYMSESRLVRGPSDASYATALAGTTHLTELRRQPHLIKDIESVELQSSNCAAARTATVGLSIDGGTSYTALTAVNSNGYQKLAAASAGVPTSALLGGRTIKPRIAYSSNVSTASPQVQWLKVRYRTRPEMVDVYKFTLELTDHQIYGDAETQQDQLITEWGSGPVSIGSEPDLDTPYVRVESVTVHEVKDTGGGQGSASGSRRIAEVIATEWST